MLFSLLLAAAAQALVSPAPIDTSALATKEQVSAAIVAASPAPCTAPLPDTLNGSAGTAPVCMTRPDATRPANVQAKRTITSAAGKWAVDFDRPYPVAPDYVDARVYGAADPYLCTVEVVTTTRAEGTCHQLVGTTLPSVVTSLLGLTLSPFRPGAAGLSVRVASKQ